MAWDTVSNANRLKTSYVKNFIDISGSLILREKSNLDVNGTTTINGNLSLNNASVLTDLSFNKRIFVGGDSSITGKISSIGDISINGLVTSCNFNDVSIPKNAFNGTIVSLGPDYTRPSVFYEKNFKANADISFNGNVVEVNRIKIDGNVKLSDASLMNKYDENMLNMFDVSSSYISSLCLTRPPSFIGGDPGFLITKSSNSGKIIAITAGGNGYSVSQNAPNSNDPISNLTTWTNYSKFGLYITRDFGNTWTKYLMPYEDETKMGFCYYDMAMSSDGKHILVIVLPNGNNPNGLPAAVAFSHDYGYTWSSTRYPCYSGAPGTNVYPTICCMSDDGKKMFVNSNGENGTIYVSIDYGLSWNAKLMSAYSGVSRGMTFLICNEDMTKLVTNPGGNSKFIYVCNLDENLNQTSSITNDITVARNGVPGRSIGSYPIYAWRSRDLKNLIFGYYNSAGTNYIEFYDATTNTWRMATPNISSITTNPSATLGLPVSGAGLNISPSGKYMYMEISIQTPTYYGLALSSSDYGYTFNIFYTSAGTRIYSIYDDGSYLSMIGQTINIFKPNVYKSSTFTTLNLTGNLIAGSLTSSSDYRIKSGISALDETFTVDNLRPVKYLQTLINKTRYGVIAHELQLYYPNLVLGEKDGEDLQYVNYTGLIAILINEIKRLKQEVLELENEV
jgi:hypothetical protein